MVALRSFPLQYIVVSSPPPLRLFPSWRSARTIGEAGNGDVGERLFSASDQIVTPRLFPLFLSFSLAALVVLAGHT